MTSPTDPAPWTLTRWFTMIMLVFGIQGILVFLFSPRTLPPASKEPLDVSIRYISRELWQTNSTARTLARDPSLLARVNRQTFSGNLWDETLALEHKSFYWTEAPRYYHRTQVIAGATLRNHVREHFSVPASVVSLPAPVLSDAELPLTPPKPRSTILVAGDIRSRLPGELPSLRSWPHTNLLHPTVVAVAVDRFGWAQTATILSNSLPAKQLAPTRLTEADDYALRWIRNLQFTPLPPTRRAVDTRLTWGEITFRWATSPLTNQISAANSS
ncbi:MAG: hypothetical protein M2R45_02328 [Verrucomicrobia subdivision 3 bacterium]|nr:hypothetical protein [Limisphaerales bacterium]MCS1414707.1 hypothetical protein [Limisphaerales bacterium]